MSDAYAAVASLEQAQALEARVVDALRGQGHAVYPKRVGLIPFGAYRG